MNIIEILKNGGVGVLMTDTIYGIVGQAFSEETVKKIYKIKGRDENKPFIVLVSKISDLEKFGIKLTENLKQKLQDYWPGKVSIILPCDKKELEYLHRGTNSLAFRYPNNKELISLIEETGPLVAPSANPQGLEPAKSIEDAKKYFGDNVDFYDDEIYTDTEIKPSTLIKIEGDSIIVLRK